MGVAPGRLPGATVSQDKTSGVRRSVGVDLVGYLLLCHQQGMRKGEGLGRGQGSGKSCHVVASFNVYFSGRLALGPEIPRIPNIPLLVTLARLSRPDDQAG